MDYEELRDRISQEILTLSPENQQKAIGYLMDIRESLEKLTEALTEAQISSNMIQTNFDKLQELGINFVISEKN